MTQEIALIFPHQLFQFHPALRKGRTVLMIEEWLFFHQYNFHKQKLILHRASMQFYRDHLQKNGYTVVYIEATSGQCDIRNYMEELALAGCKKIHYADVVDDWLRQRMQQSAALHQVALHEFPTPLFLNSMPELKEYFEGRNRYFQTDFYIHQRKKRGILIEGNHFPAGGRWSYDADNRKKFPKQETIPEYAFPPVNKYIKEATAYVTKNFSSNYGNENMPFQVNLVNAGYYPVTFEQASAWLNGFLENRLAKFGVYEDAMVAGENILYHSVLSPLLNTGLLQPQYVLDRVIHAWKNEVLPLNTVEGFIRQVIGWREYIRAVYELEGRKQRTTNYWGFTRKIPASFRQGTTGITPVDTVIHRVWKSGYTHHIERLMVLGNFMLLCEFHPDEVYRWFMEMFVDAYDWVMVPNTYGMTQFADGGLMMTKPYISSSNYIMKMSNFPKGPWQHTWDSLFWKFMHVHRDFFNDNPRLGMLLKTYDKMPAYQRNDYIQHADAFLKRLDDEAI